MISEKEINDRLQKDIEILLYELILNLKNEPIAIYLCGGYGRNEGAWWIDSEGRLQPYNDYDLAVITNSPMNREKYLKVRKILAKKIGIQWIDINFYTLEEIHNFRPTIKNYDLIHASKLIYGKFNLKLEAPFFSSSDITKKDIDILFKTRIWTFLGSWKGDFHKLNNDEALFFRNQMAKSILAACDMLLIKEKKYNESYRKRIDIICSLYANNINLCKLAKWALNEKMRPTYQTMEKNDMMDLYWNCKQVFVDAFKLADNKKYRYYSKSNITKLFIILHSRYLLVNSYNKILKKNKKIEFNLDVFLLQNYIFWSNDRGCVNAKYIKAVVKILNKWKISNVNQDWNNLRNIVANLRNEN